MKVILRILGLFLLMAGAGALYNAGYETAMAGVVVFIIFPYFAMLVAYFVDNSKEIP